MKTLSPQEVDILVLDADDQPVMAVETRAQADVDEAAQTQLVHYLQDAGTIGYAMLVDRQRIQIFEWKDGKLSGPVLEAGTSQVLSFYDAEFANKQIFQYYFQKLVQAWLNDVAYHWKSVTPPLYEELARIGLAQQFKEGAAMTEAVVAAEVA